jgi:hypothetical protein
MKPVALLAAAAALVAVALIAFLMMPPGEDDGGGGAAVPGGGAAALTVDPEGLEAPDRAPDGLVALTSAEATAPTRSADAVVDPGPWLEVVDPQGRPIPGADVYWADPFAELSSGEGLFTNVTITGAAGLDQLLLDRGERGVTGDDGRWRLPEFSRAMHVLARFDGATALKTLRVEELREVQQVVLKATARFEIQFIDGTGQAAPVEQLVVDVRKQGSDQWQPNRTLTAFGSKGRFVLPMPALLNARRIADWGLAHPPGIYQPPGGYAFEFATPPREVVEWVLPPSARMFVRLEQRDSSAWDGLKWVRVEVDHDALGWAPGQPRTAVHSIAIQAIETVTQELAQPGDPDWIVNLHQVQVQTPLLLSFGFASGLTLGPVSVTGPRHEGETHVVSVEEPGEAREVGVRFEMRDPSGLPMDFAELHLALSDAKGRRLPSPLAVGERSDENGRARVESPWVFASTWPEPLRGDAWPAPFALRVQADWNGRRWTTETLEVPGTEGPALIDLGPVTFQSGQSWLQGIVIDSRGEPLPDAQIRVEPDDAPSNLGLYSELASHGTSFNYEEALPLYTTRSDELGRFQLWGTPVETGFVLTAQIRREWVTPSGQIWSDLAQATTSLEAPPTSAVELRLAPRFLVHGRLSGDADRLRRVKLGLASEGSAPGGAAFEGFLGTSDNVQYDGATGEWCAWTRREGPLRVRAGVLGELGEVYSSEVLEPTDNARTGGLDVGVGELRPAAAAPGTAEAGSGGGVEPPNEDG